MRPTYPAPLSRIAPLLLTALLAAACGTSPAVRYHTLSSGVQAQPAGAPAMLVEILPVRVPPALDRPQVAMTGATPGRLDLRETDRWAAPLSEEVRHALASALWRERRAADVSRVASAGGSVPRLRLSMALESFDAGPGPQATLAALWSLRRLPDGAPLTCRSLVRADLGGAGADAAVAALARTVDRLGQEIAAALGGMDGDPARCPVD